MHMKKKNPRFPSQWNGKERSLYYEPQAFYTPVDKLEEQKNGQYLFIYLSIGMSVCLSVRLSMYCEPQAFYTPVD